MKHPSFRHSFIMFTGVPLLFWALNSLPDRSLLKETLSVVTILVFYQMLGMFFWSRINRYSVKNMQMIRVIRIHKMIGYTGMALLLLHPVSLILPRFYEPGISGAEAFMTIITTTNPGVVSGIVAWGLMLVIGLTALTRKHLPIKYKTWRNFHGILALIFVFSAAWHVIDLGRHSSMAMSIFIIILTAGNILLFGMDIIIKKNTKIEI